MHSKFVWVNHHDDTMYVWEEVELFRPLLYCRLQQRYDESGSLVVC